MHWIQTISGKAFDLDQPKPDMVDFNDIATALSKICRFNGHCRGFYSVAEHCVRVARAMPAFKIYGLLHDAHEAYIGDITTPTHAALMLMNAGTSIDDLKEKVDVAIYKAAGIPPLAGHPAEPLVKVLDKILCQTERRDLLAPPPASWGAAFEQLQPLPEKIEPWAMADAERIWLRAFVDGIVNQEAA